MRTSARNAIEVQRRIAARPETVFSYFTDAERFRRWHGVDAELDPRPGGIFKVRQTGRSGVTARGEYLEVDPPRRVVFTWGWERVEGLPRGMAEVGPGASTVEVDLIPDGEGTVVHLRHSGLPSEACCRIHLQGWDLTLDRLVVAGSGRDPGPYPFADA